MLNLIPSMLNEAMSALNRSSLEMAGFRERLGGVMP